MVKFIPPYHGQEINSNAEKKVFSYLKELKLENVYIFHSLGLPKHKDKIYGEIDFVILCDRGIACFEVKGGRVERKDGKWSFKDRYENETFKEEGPFDQVKNNMFSLKKIINDNLKEKIKNKKILFSCGVLFPDIEFKDKSEEIIQEIVFDQRTKDITEYIKRIFDYWKERNEINGKVDKLSPEDMEIIAKYLRGNFTFIPSLSNILEEIDRRIIRLTEEQSLIIDSLSENDRLLIKGSAGTGKTVLAMKYAKDMYNQGKKVLYLTYNRHLASELNKYLNEDEKIKIININALFGEKLEEYVNRADKESMNKFFIEEQPNLYINYLKSLDNDELENLKYDVVIMDEGQDLIRINFLTCIDLLLKDGLEKGKCAIFYDPNQNIYNTEFKEAYNILESGYNFSKFKLNVNCRNTLKIGSCCNELTGHTFDRYLVDFGEDVINHYYSDEKEYKNIIEKILNDLRKEKISMKDIIFLAPKNLNKTNFANLGIKVNEVGSSNYEEDIPYFSTIHRYKGLDSKIVILIELENANKENYNELLYIAITRARTLLYILYNKDLKGEI